MGHNVPSFHQSGRHRFDSQNYLYLTVRDYILGHRPINHIVRHYYVFTLLFHLPP
jgi:hypothetical protein